MCVGHVVHAVCHTHQAHNPKLQTSYALCPNCTHQHPPSRHNALFETQHAKVVGKRVTGEQNAAALVSLVYKHPIINSKSRVMKRGENHKLPKPKQRKDPHTKTCSLLQ